MAISNLTHYSRLYIKLIFPYARRKFYKAIFRSRPGCSCECLNLEAGENCTMSGYIICLRAKYYNKRMRHNRNAYKIVVRGLLENLRTDGRNILKWALRNYGVRLCIGIIWQIIVNMLVGVLVP